MLNKFNKHLKNEKGLTLIELLAVIVILAIIAAIAVPAIGGIINNSTDKAKLATASNILAGAKIAMVDGACGDTTPDECGKTELNGYVEGVADSLDYSAKKITTDGVITWSVTYAGLTGFNSKKYTGSTIGTTLTETELNRLLGL